MVYVLKDHSDCWENRCQNRSTSEEAIAKVQPKVAEVYMVPDQIKICFEGSTGVYDRGLDTDGEKRSRNKKKKKRSERMLKPINEMGFGGIMLVKQVKQRKTNIV